MKETKGSDPGDSETPVEPTHLARMREHKSHPRGGIGCVVLLRALWFNYLDVLPFLVEEWGLSGTEVGNIFALLSEYLLSVHSSAHADAIPRTANGNASKASVAIRKDASLDVERDAHSFTPQ